MSDDFNQMTDSLTSMVTEVRQAADSITGASSQIASGNLDLSNRTEHAAASLQHAAASLDALSGTVRKTAEASHAANDIAKSAATSAGQGRDLVLQVVSRMDGIQASSNRISDITSVIDGIAFQTNILALNAAVEAARAGEQGRGFAVVAGEVRSLAQRSAEAAREIKALIENSREEVTAGSQVAHDAGASMSRIVSQVAEVSAMIQTITQDANTQSGEISDVNKAMSELEQMTQQNAALVEQAAAASASLQEQADKMVEVMGMFAVGAPSRHTLLLA
jgi:methyl-accepting chemotaxis protein